MNRRSFLKKLFGGIITLFGVSGGTYYYAREIEPHLLDIQHVDIHSYKTPVSFHNYKILQFTDTHIGFQYSIEELNDLIKQMNQLEPDIVVFTGDLIDNPRTYRIPLHWWRLYSLSKRKTVSIGFMVIMIMVVMGQIF